MINASQLTELIINPALRDLNMFSEDAVELLLFTCAVESSGGFYLKQTHGVALGIYQMEPQTHVDLWESYIKIKPSLLLMISEQFGIGRVPDEYRMIYDLRYATAMARLFYKRVSEKLPSKSDIEGLWRYYKEFYNTYEGKSEKEKSIQKYLQFIQSASG